MTEITIYTKDWCGYCHAAKHLLTQLGYQYTDIDVTHDVARYQEMRGKAKGRSTVPQIFVNGESIGGYTDLRELVKNKQLPPP
jgi:glutaredoxin 3